MQSKLKAETKTVTKKPFTWGISSATISFMQTNELQAARDGSGGSDCSKVSPLPQPKGRSRRRVADKA